MNSKQPIMPRAKKDFPRTMEDPEAPPEDPRGDASVARMAQPETEPPAAPSRRVTRQPTEPTDDEIGEPLLTTAEKENMRSRWRSVQEKFVDDPELAVENADELVGEAIGRLSEIFRDTRERIEKEWGKDEDSRSTEELRQALRRYRAFFDRILAV